MKVTITKVFFNDKNANGEPYVSKKSGKPYILTKFQTQEHGSEYLSAFDADGWTRGWKIGDTLDLDIEEKMWNGRKQYEARKTGPMTQMKKDFDQVKKFLMGKFPTEISFDENTKSTPPPTYNQPEEKIDVNNLPW